ncbi:hypothetical protein COCSADRAFT_185949 [Bipolaris sorokiniana ND90Pr]|uniref:4-dimethylallyltryptophan synthase n=1 Tax=Cochliobolus sativus (strain ND90Pr / ATCC 201652) TaxID=665912 RepID=M2S773_COCSN|nr:uncharacterized protein COCSADRAFT_185949 [Bipolaris sorokiniana ND90Pr]EMD58220.1 hypothetical protein COCSADRAFT_185949 [Bipolaris sorokiniana ND90Pr]
MAPLDLQVENASHHQIFEKLSKLAHTCNEDQRLWWHSVGPMIAEMLNTANYDASSQYKQLHIFLKYVIPFLGVYPTNSHDRWMSIINTYGSPIEPGLNCNDSAVKYSFEPINNLTGTTADPFNTHAVWDAIKGLVSLDPTIDTEYFRYFKNELTLNETESNLLRDKHLAPTDIMSQNILALDLKGDKFKVKVYFYAALKALVTGKSVNELMFGSVRMLAKRQANIAAGLDMLEEYIDSRAPDGNLFPRLLSCDLLKPTKSRIKIYVSEQVVSLAAISDMWTLGGRRADPTTLAGLDLIQELWELLKIPEGVRKYPKGYQPLGSSSNELLPTMANYTLHPDHAVPMPQIYFWVFGMNDMAIADALTIFFQRHGWTEMAKKYKNSLKAYYPNEEHDHMNYVHASISFSYRKNKPYLSVYYHSFETGDWASNKYNCSN